MSVAELERLLHEKETEFKINQYLIEFYTGVIDVYKKTGDTTYIHPVDSRDPFMAENISRIIEEIKEIFPDCSVQNYIQGRNGNMVIVTEVTENCRVVDWG